jgi:histone H3/H4
MVDLIVKSKIKEAVKELNVAGEVAEALNKKVEHLLHEAAERAKANGRRTLQARDI